VILGCRQRLQQGLQAGPEEKRPASHYSYAT
jgi:hypothetical protein